MLWFRNLRIVLCFVIFSRGILWSEPERFGLSIIREDGNGALPYDVASLLYDAIVVIPDEQREELLDGYICGYRLTGRWSRDYSVHVFLSFCIGTAVAGDGGFRASGTLRKKTAFYRFDTTRSAQH